MPLQRPTSPVGLIPPAAAPAHERQRFAEHLLDELTPAMSALGLLFLLVVLGERSARPGSTVAVVMAILGWVLWAVFLGEFVLRLVIAPDKRLFLRRNWWQLVFFVLPFLRVLRLVRSLRVLRTGRVLSSAVRTSRSTSRVLRDRVAWLGVVTALVVLTSAELLTEFGIYRQYADALHATALAAIAGEPLGQPDAFARVLEIALTGFSVAVFATLAGTVGAYLLENRVASPTPGAEPVLEPAPAAAPAGAPAQQPRATLGP